MEYSVKFIAGDFGSEGCCVYRCGDLTLLYEVKTPLVPSHQCFLIFDTLTLIFEGTDRRLTSLDAYTNSALWKTSEIVSVPEVAGHGSLHLTESLGDDDRCAIDSNPYYEASRDGKWVRVILKEEVSVEYYEVANDLLVGLVNDKIAELFLLNLQLSD